MTLKYPKQVQTLKGKIAYWVFWHIYVFSLGKDRVIGRPFTFIPELAMIMVFLKVFGIYDPSKMQILGLVLIFLGASFLSGLIYYRMGLDRIERLITEERNILLKGIHDKVNGNEDKVR